MNPLEIVFPELGRTGYAITSPPTLAYNCIGWAAGEDDRWWWPDAAGGYYWPTRRAARRIDPAFAAAFATIGFAPSTNSNLEPDVLKIAIYARSGIPTHAARQLANGNWTSKLGEAEDIEHALAGLVGPVYGDVALILAIPNP